MESFVSYWKLISIGKRSIFHWKIFSWNVPLENEGSKSFPEWKISFSFPWKWNFFGKSRSGTSPYFGLMSRSTMWTTARILFFKKKSLNRGECLIIYGQLTNKVISSRKKPWACNLSQISLWTLINGF
jgi:hypothetical protein